MQGLLTELLVPDNPGGLALEQLGLSNLLDCVVAQPDLQVGHVVSAHVCHTVGGSEDVLPGNEAATAELPAVVEEGGDPGPLALVGVPAAHNLRPGLILALHLLGDPAVAVVANGEVAADTTLSR